MTRTPKATTGLWMLQDLEPWPDPPSVGEVFAPTTFWLNGEASELPPELCSRREAQIEPRASDGRIEWIADLGEGFTTMLPAGSPTAGRTVLTGCLIWDHYLWLDYRTEPTGRVRLLGRPGHIVQRQHLSPTRHPTMFSVSYDGPTVYCPTREVPKGFGIRWNVLRVEPV